ncbi:hypothetical protein PHISCL_03982 [Aspergillus sclerotialis]|uniref:Shelterin complex subunit TPP1/Est3 domain-containing protein n=1 Tax=Aspergillus sclerotialis TaxID=2070753 RepID=A0A3A2ZQE7_9EURO|nr:hypothetical protein PHISCL_03982 [Aspergillus sclerotialis]
MASTSTWIAALTEQCLSAYLSTTGESNFQWEDDGSNIRFTDHSPKINRPVLVAKWMDGETPIRATLTDSANQVGAIVTRTSLEIYRKESPNYELTGTGIHGYLINLQEFEIVLEYITSKPAIHFYIKRFSIGWNYGRQRFSLGKKLNNDRGVSGLLQSAFKKANEARIGPHSVESVDGDQSDNASIKSQNNTNSHSFPSQNTFPDAGISQEPFVSQVPAACPEIANVSAGNEPHHLTYKTELLGHLERQSKKEKDDMVMNTNHIKQQDANIGASGKMKEQSHVNKRGSREADRSSTSHNHDFHAPTSLPEITPRGKTTDAKFHDLNGSADLGPPASARVAENRVAEISARMEEQQHTPEASNGGNSEAEKTQSQTLVGVDRQAEKATPPDNLNPSYSDSWAGLTRIRSHDIRIPQDQKSLLEDKRCWIPPSPGMHIPRGHVPPSLLNGWNTSVLRRSRLTQQNELSNPASRTPYIYEMSLSPSPGSGSDVDSEEALSWSSSPVQHTGRDELPADSSPVRTRRVPEGVPSASEINSRQSQPSRETGSRTYDNTNENTGPRHENTDEVPPNTENPSHPDGEKINPVSSQSRFVASPQDPDNESDGSDGESAMDTSIPCPLGGSSQNVQQASQSEQEITSSGPSLPGIPRQEQIQVFETPAANLSRLRSEIVENDNSNDGTCAYSSQQRSSQTGKLSSQSRIFNTYGSNEHERKEYTSQETLNSSLEGETGPNIHVTGTQISNEKWPVQQPEPQSPSALVLDSSERARRERSASLSVPTSEAAHSQPSQPFPSSREVPSTQSDGGTHDLGAQNSPRVAHSHNRTEVAQTPTLKREATKTEDEQSRPSKRHKSAHESGHMDKVNEKHTPNTAIRRQSYINGPSKPVDTLKAFERFQNDYPNYSGDFAHFTELCRRLQALRTQGKLTRSFLWDDFVIMHLQEYPRYLEECSASDTKMLAYEDYFTSNFSKPSYRRRSLTASTLDLCALQYAPSNRPNHPRRSPGVCGEVDALSAERRSDVVEEKSSDPSYIPLTPSFGSTEQGGAISYNKSKPNIQETNSSDGEDTDSRIEEAHRAPSIDLGDEDHIPYSRQKSPSETLEASREEESEPESINENWFTSLRHIRPSGPKWSDDPNTPFKVWARADQNILSERRRRGGRYLAVDEHGVIQRYTTDHKRT